MSIKILLADDSITIQKVVGIIFGGEDYSLTVVDNGKSAVEKAKELDPDVLLIDALMPGMNGYEVCEAVRANAALANKPILLLTGSFEPFDETKAKSCGADDFIAKPFESQQIITKVKELFELGKNRVAPAASFSEPPILTSEPPTISFPETAAPVIAATIEQTHIAQPPIAQVSSQFEPTAFEPTSFAPDFTEPEPAAPKSAEPLNESTTSPAIWDAFTPAEPEPPQTTASSQSASTMPVEDVFAMVTEEEQEPITSSQTSAIQQPEPQSQHIDSPWIPVEEQTFDFREETIADVPSAAFETPVPLEESSSFGDISFGTSSEAEDVPVTPATEFKLPVDMPFSEPAPAPIFTESAPSSFDTSFQEPLEAAASAAVASTASDIFAAAAATVTSTSSAVLTEKPVVPTTNIPASKESEAILSPASEAVTEAAAPTPAITEEQLKIALTSLSKDAIERIVWEVVPDLAEVLIKEAIRKIKEGM